MAISSVSVAAAAVVVSVLGVAAYHHMPCLGSPCGGGYERWEKSRNSAERLSAQVVEVRSASVFAGACHYNGELTTSGGEALLAVRVESGASDGVDLGGVCAAALVSSGENLKQGAARRSVVYVSEGASAAQRDAIVELLGERSSKGLGQIVAVESLPVSVQSSDSAFAVEVGDKIRLSGAPLADKACCKMPQEVWYEPLVQLDARVVGNTQTWRVNEPRLALDFQRCEENSAFVGRLAVPRSCCSKPCEPASSID